MATPYLGYRFGLRQQAVTVTFGFGCPATVEFEALDRWLKDVLEIEMEPVRGAINPSSAHGPAVELAWRILLVTRAIRQAARLPVFEAGRLLKLVAADDPGQTCRVLAAVPELDGVPLRAGELACKVAAEVTLRVLETRADASVLEQLHTQMDAQAIKPLAAMGVASVSTFPILQAAFRRSIPCRHLGGGVYQLGWGTRARIMRMSSVDGDSAIGATLCARKDWTANALRAAGLPAARHQLVADQAQALAAARDLGWPVVVKPADRERSEGVCVGIESPEQVIAGWQEAAALSAHVLVERQVPGSCYRLLVANGTFMYAISRNPVSVTGDGSRTVAQLIADRADGMRKRPPWRRKKVIGLDALTRRALGEQGVTVDTVAAPGQRLALRAIESSEWGGEIEDATSAVHTHNIEIAERAARLFGLRNAGIDLITPDVSRPWHENGAVINEVNYAPFFGGNPVAQACLPQFLAGFVEQDGRLPVDVFMGGSDAAERARAAQRDALAAGARAHLTSHTFTLDPDGAQLPLAAGGLFERVLALLTRPDVQSLIVVVQTDEWLYTGLPVNRIDRIHRCDGQLVAYESGKAPVSDATQRMIARLQAYVT